MAQDLRELFKAQEVSTDKMPQGHEARFLKKLDETLPQAPVKPKLFSFLNNFKRAFA